MSSSKKLGDLIPTREMEADLCSQGYRLVAGVDEVGRGPLAGPVMAGAVVLPPGLEAPWTHQVRDSKQLTPRARERLSTVIRQSALAVGTGEASVEEVDRSGIVAATRLAMARAIYGLGLMPDFLLIDALPLPRVPIRQHSFYHGDALCLSIACASIVAKVARDHLMEQVDLRYPGFGFCRNKGYGTPEHIQALKRLGPCPIHRRSFAPVSALVAEALPGFGAFSETSRGLVLEDFIPPHSLRSDEAPTFSHRGGRFGSSPP